MDNVNREEGVAAQRTLAISLNNTLLDDGRARAYCDIPAILETSKGIVPREERSKEPEEATSLLETHGGGHVAIVGGEVLAGEEEEGQVEGEEEQEEGDGGPQGAEEQ